MHPLEHVHLDYLCLKLGKGLEENVLVVTDHFTQYAQAYVTQYQTAKTMAKASGTNSSSPMGCPKRSSQIMEEIL